MALPVQNEEEAGAILQEARKTHKEANHNVFAYVVGKRGELPRASDDGEPQGTAGAPVLNVLASQGITNAIVIVTRYYGGINLGAGGLVRAYSQAAKEAVYAAGIKILTPCLTYDVLTEYSLLSKFQHEFNKSLVKINSVEYEADVTLNVTIEADRQNEFTALCADLSNGAAIINLIERGYM
jgi:uncharacterized YigZ family protein